MGVPIFLKLEFSQLWGPITFSANLRLRWGLKQSCSPHQDLSNSMSQATWTQGNRGDSRLLVVGSQIVNSIPDPSFGHNLCFKCPNGSCEPISDIVVPSVFQWYKELFNPIRFDPCNHILKIRESIGTPTPKMRVHLGVWGFILSHSFALLGAWNVTPKLSLGPHLCKPLAWLQAQG